jgi:hypothetical protein
MMPASQLSQLKRIRDKHGITELKLILKEEQLPKLLINKKKLKQRTYLKTLKMLLKLLMIQLNLQMKIQETEKVHQQTIGMNTGLLRLFHNQFGTTLPTTTQLRLQPRMTKKQLKQIKMIQNHLLKKTTPLLNRLHNSKPRLLHLKLTKKKLPIKKYTTLNKRD